MAPPQLVSDLVERFERNVEAYKSPHYNEAQVRTEFVDPFFEALGWDVPNREGLAEAYKDVTREISIKVGADTKAPDYCFRIGGTPKFFLEAKKPAVNIKQDQGAAFQLRRYAWSRKLPLSLLTNFAELAIYDCRIGPPSQADAASKARTLYFTYRDYIEQWDEIAGRFSKDAVLRGSFDKYVETAKLKRGTTQVDAAFLKRSKLGARTSRPTWLCAIPP
jgi:predicted type IV restriction endonuclease